MQQARDFGAESAALAGFLERLAPGDWNRPTGFKGWSPNDILVHLHVWNLAQDLALQDPEAFRARVGAMEQAIAEGRARDFEAGLVAERGPELLRLWATQAAGMATRWEEVDPKRRLPWAGPDMSARSAMSARQMETWAHGLAIWDMLGADRPETDRIRNIVHLGVTAFGWSFKVHGQPVPDTLPHLRLTAPSGTVWEYGQVGATDRITGLAADFARVVTQTRNIADTALAVEGPVARAWMAQAQCFAGPPETPPAPGTRGPRGQGLQAGR
ncbi:MAG: TIGR03084 family metal-binding protein [Paracoccaceae bacterium]